MIKRILLIIGFSVIGFLAGYNVCLLWDGDGIGQFFSMIFGSVGALLSFGLVFIPTDNKWLMIPKLVAILTMVLTAVGRIHEFPELHPLEFLIFPANVVLTFLCAVSIIAVIKKSNQ